MNLLSRGYTFLCASKLVVSLKEFRHICFFEVKLHCIYLPLGSFTLALFSAWNFPSYRRSLRKGRGHWRPFHLARGWQWGRGLAEAQQTGGCREGQHHHTGPWPSVSSYSHACRHPQKAIQWGESLPCVLISSVKMSSVMLSNAVKRRVTVL